jgi:hypothetical protein
LRAKNPGRIVHSIEHIEHDFDTFRLHRKAFTAPGPDKLSRMAKSAFAGEILRRTTSLAIFDEVWEASSLLTDLRMQSRKIQLGLIERPANIMPHDMIVADEKLPPGSFAPRSLKDDLETLTRGLKNLVEHNTENYPRSLVYGLLQTITYINLYYNEELNTAANSTEAHGLIDWQSVPMSATSGLEKYKQDVLYTKDQAKAMILKHGMGALTIEDVDGRLEAIDPDYAQAKRKFDADRRLASEHSSRKSSYQKINGFNAA